MAPTVPARLVELVSSVVGRGEVAELGGAAIVVDLGAGATGAAGDAMGDDGGAPRSSTCPRSSSAWRRRR